MEIKKSKESIILKVEKIRKAFGGLRALDGVTFDLKYGAITALVGPNGAGKTTAFNIITKFLSPDKGEVFFKGERITNLPPHRIAKLGIGRTFQDVRIFSKMTVLENLMVATPHQKGENIAALMLWPWQIFRQEGKTLPKNQKWLEFIRLLELADELAENLSYGQQKLLSLARILSLGADLLLLDEPMSGLDPSILSASVDLLRSLTREYGKSICLIEHNIDIVRDLADQVIFFDQGRVIADGGPEKIFSDQHLSELYFGK